MLSWPRSGLQMRLAFNLDNIFDETDNLNSKGADQCVNSLQKYVFAFATSAN